MRPDGVRRSRDQNKLPVRENRGKDLLGEEVDKAVALSIQHGAAFVWLQRGKVVFMSQALNELLEEYSSLNPDEFEDA